MKAWNLFDYSVSCGEEVEVDEDLLYDETQDIVCPACNEVIIHAEDDKDEE